VGVLAGLYLSVWAVFASGSRSSLVGAAAALLVYVVLRPGLGFLRSTGRLVALCVVCGVTGTALAVTGQLPATLEERINRSLDSSDPAAQTHLVADREHLANAGARAFMESPLLGTGLDNFRYVTPRYDVEATPQLPHNLWLQLLVQVGAIGTAAMALYLLAWVRELTVRTRRVHPLDTQLMWSLVASLAGVLVIFMFAPEMLDRHYWLIVALGLATLHGTQPDAIAERTTDP
jgi:O-antigen ligase